MFVKFNNNTKTYKNIVFIVNAEQTEHSVQYLSDIRPEEIIGRKTMQEFQNSFSDLLYFQEAQKDFNYLN